MTILRILPIDDPHLRNKTFPVDVEDPSEMDRVRTLIADMFETCKEFGGAGLAANQVGSHDRVFVMDMSEQGLDRVAFINPEIIERSDEIQTRKEGCLSMPGIFIEIERHAQVKVRFTDVHGLNLTYDARGYSAICCQHEIDHLDGIRHIDHVSSLKQMMLMTKWKKGKA